MSATWLDTFPELQPDFVSGSVSGVAVSAVEPVPLSRAPVMERDCPKCGSHQNASAKECRACGLVFEKFERTRAFALEGAPGEIRLEGRRELAEFWEQVLAAYDQEEMHQIFIRECDEANCLAFASAKYARILWANPHEEVAKKMRKRIIGLASIKMETVPSTRPWSFRILGMHGLAISLASATMTIGLMLPGQKNLAGIGFAWLALLIGARVMLRPPLR